MAQLIISIMSKSFSKNPIFSEIGVRVWWVANLINCNVGFVCISLPTEKSSNLGQKCCQASSYFFPPFQSIGHGISKLNLLSSMCAFKIKKSKLRTFLFPGAIWEFADIVKQNGIDQDKGGINKHIWFKHRFCSVLGWITRNWKGRT